MDWVSTVASPGVIVGLKGERWRQQGHHLGGYGSNLSEIEFWLGLGWQHGRWGRYDIFWQLLVVIGSKRKRNWE